MDSNNTHHYRHVIPMMMRLKREPSCKNMEFKPKSPFPNADMVLKKIKSEGNKNPSIHDLAKALFLECNKWFKEFVPSQNLGWTLKDGILSRPGAKVCFDAKSITRKHSVPHAILNTVQCNES